MSRALAMDKQFILDEIRRTATSHCGQPLGSQKFERETGIRRSDWLGKYWRNWGEALSEAGFTPNEFCRAYDDQHLLEQFVSLIRELKRLPRRGRSENESPPERWLSQP